MSAVLGLALTGLLAGALALRWSLVVGDADEWVVQIRNGRSVRQGVGIQVLRLPGDTIARFSSTVQRVRFTADVLTRDRLEARVEAFVLWSIDPAAEGPFRAFRRLGLVNLEQAPPNHFGRHLLSRPQYHAFQQAFAALIQHWAGQVDFDQLVLDPTEMVASLRQQAAASLAGYGVTVEDAGVLQIRPSDAQVFSHLQAPSAQAIREQADQARMQTEQRLSTHKIASELALEAQRTQLDHAKQERLDAEVRADVAREKLRTDAEAQRIRTLAKAEQDKSAELRQFELERLRTQEMANALGRLPMKEARWYSVGKPLDSLAELLG